jgi:hypothetical protein
MPVGAHGIQERVALTALLAGETNLKLQAFTQ